MKTWTEINYDALLEQAKDKFADETEAASVKIKQLVTSFRNI